MRLVHLTDLHLTTPGKRLFGLDPLQRLDQALADIAAHQPDASHLLVTGDLTDRGEPQAYAALAERLSGIAAEPVLLIGNHDDRGAFLDRFGTDAADGNGFVQRVVDGGDGVSLVTLDTHVPGQLHGALCETRLAWLDQVLAARADRAVYLAMHHPPVASGIRFMDAIGLEGADRFWSVVDAHPQTRHVFAGHIHRPFFARRGPVTVSTLPAPAHQVQLVFTVEDVALGSLEAGAYGIADLGMDGFGLHVRAFTDNSRRFVFDDASSAAMSPEALPPVPEPYDRSI